MKLRLPRSDANMCPKWAQASSSNNKLGCGEVAKNLSLQTYRWVAGQLVGSSSPEFDGCTTQSSTHICAGQQSGL